MSWAFEGMSPRDWVAILEIEVQEDLEADGQGSARRTDKDLLAWLVNTGDFFDGDVRNDHLSSLRRSTEWDSPYFSGRSVHFRVLECVRKNIRARSVFSHLLNVRFQVAGIYNPSISRDTVDELEGIFLAKRLSVAQAGWVNVSAFRFYRDERKRPIFEEKRVIEHEGEGPYQMRSRGSWHLERNAYLLSGITYRIPIDIGNEYELKLDAIDRVHEDRVLLHHDGNPGFLRGVMASIVRRENAPGVTEMVLDQITLPDGLTDTEFWDTIEHREFFHRDTVTSSTERLGVRKPEEGELEYLRLRPNHPAYHFPLVVTRQI